jgi:hypothetical protein
MIDMDNMSGVQILLLMGAAFAVGLAGGTAWPRRGWALWALGVGMVFPLLVVLTIVRDLSRDSASHNLFPFEILLACAFSLAPAFAGAFAGGLLRRSFRRRGGANGPPSP